MKKTIWICGIIAGVISVTWGVFSDGLIGNHLSMNTKMFFGYATMVLAFSLIFVGIKNYRDNYNNGQIKFGKALGIGLLITLIASTVYVVVWMIDFAYFLPDFSKGYTAQIVAEMKASGATAAAIQKKTADMNAEFAAYNSSPVFRILFTYMEIAPVGIVMSLIGATILKKKTNFIAAA